MRPVKGSKGFGAVSSAEKRTQKSGWIMKKKTNVHWYNQCADIVHGYGKSANRNRNEAFEVVKKICEVLERHGFIDCDWWAENEKIKD